MTSRLGSPQRQAGQNSARKAAKASAVLQNTPSWVARAMANSIAVAGGPGMTSTWAISQAALITRTDMYSSQARRVAAATIDVGLMVIWH